MSGGIFHSLVVLLILLINPYMPRLEFLIQTTLLLKAAKFIEDSEKEFLFFAFCDVQFTVDVKFAS